MNRIIVTIRINQKKEYDLELPVHQKIKDLMQDISDSLEGLDPLSWFDPEKVSFMDKRTGRRLNPENSLLEECVWNGDILEIQGYKYNNLSRIKKSSNDRSLKTLHVF